MSQLPDIDRIVQKARAMQTAHDTCEANGGHWYAVDGFSAIAHPETGWPFFQHPKVSSFSDLVFKAYVCRDCGRRVSVEEGRTYMAAKQNPLAEQERVRREMLELADITPEMERWYRTDG